MGFGFGLDSGFLFLFLNLRIGKSTPVAVAIVVVYSRLLVFCRAGAVDAVEGLDLELGCVGTEAAEVG